MANSILDACESVGKCNSFCFHNLEVTGPGLAAPGLVCHGAVTYEVQVQLVSAIAETGSASMDDCIAALAGHGAPVSAVIALVAAGVLECEPGLVMPWTRVSLASPAASGRGGDGSGPGAECKSAVPGEGAVVPFPASVTHIKSTRFVPELSAVKLADRSDLPETLTGPAIYCALKDREAYCGVTGKGRERVLGAHLRGFERVVLIRDASGQMSERQAAIAERILGLTLAGLKGYALTHPLPHGASGTMAEYQDLRLFVGEALLLARRIGFGFAEISDQDLIAGPRGDNARMAPPRGGAAPAGEPCHLYAAGVAAQALVEDGEWRLLAGSEVRTRVVRSATAVMSSLRHEWLFSGVLRDEGTCYRLAEDVIFPTGSGAANFVLGSKGPNLSAWSGAGETALARLPAAL